MDLKKIELYRKGLLALFLVLNIACAGRPPLVAQNIAVEAEKYAKENNALKYAPREYNAGVKYLKQAHYFFEKRVYSKAEEAYIYARKYFENAEVQSRIKQIKEGGVF